MPEIDSTGKTHRCVLAVPDHLIAATPLTSEAAAAQLRDRFRAAGTYGPGTGRSAEVMTDDAYHRLFEVTR